MRLNFQQFSVCGKNKQQQQQQALRSQEGKWQPLGLEHSGLLGASPGAGRGPGRGAGPGAGRGPGRGAGPGVGQGRARGGAGPRAGDRAWAQAPAGAGDARQRRAAPPRCVPVYASPLTLPRCSRPCQEPSFGSLIISASSPHCICNDLFTSLRLSLRQTERSLRTRAVARS